MVPTSPRGTHWEPSPRPAGSGADWDNARLWFAEWADVDWAKFFEMNPEIQMRILGDIFREVRKLEAKRRGTVVVVSRRRRVGTTQRSLASDAGSLEELDVMLTPRLSMDPFPIAMVPLIEENRGVRGLARRAKMTHTTILRMMSGQMPLEMFRLVQIAGGAGVAPAYFKEWREAHVLTVVAQMLAASPNLSIKFSRALQLAAQGENGR